MNNIFAKLTVAILVLLGVFAVVFLVGLGEEGRLVSKEVNFEGRAVENGALLFEANCVGCHGIQGQGIPGVGPALNSQAFFTTRLQEVGYAGSLRSYVESTVNAGRPVGSGQYSAVMPTWGQEYGGPLRPDQVRDVTSYVLNWEEAALAAGETAAATPAAPAIPEGATPVEIGEVVYTAQGCAGCHGAAGGAGVIGPSLAGIATRGAETVPGQSAEEYIRTSIVNPQAYIVPECPTGPCQAGLMPQNYGQTLSPEELDGLVEYLLTFE